MEKNVQEKSNSEMKEDEVFQSKPSAEIVEVMDSLLYNAAVKGYKNMPVSIADKDDNDDDEDEVCDEWRNLEANEEYFTRKTCEKNNILHLSIQLEHFTFAAKVGRRFPRLISETNEQRNNCLHIAAQIGDVDFVELIVGLYQEKIKDEKSQPWMGKNKEGNTPLHVALIYGRIKIACYLVDLDPRLAGICNNSNEAPLHVAIRHRIDDDRVMVGSVLKLFMEDVKERLKTKRCCKLEKFSMPIVKLLLKADPSVVNWRDNKGLTPPLIAATLNPSYVEAINIMIQCCPESLEKCDYFGNSILHLLTTLLFKYYTDFKNVMELLTSPQICALKNKQNEDGNTPTHIAIQNNNIELIVIFIKSSVNLAIKNKKGVSAAYLIQQGSSEFLTRIKNKRKEIGRQLSRLRETESTISTEFLMDIKFSIEKIKRCGILHKMTGDGNILHELLRLYGHYMEDDEAREFIIQVLDMAPSLICDLDYYGKTPLHAIAERSPVLIDDRLHNKIMSCFEQVNEEEDAVEGLWYEPPWKVKDDDGNTILHLALSHDKWLEATWIEKILEFDVHNMRNQVNEKGELPLHVFVRTVCNSDHRRKNYDNIAETLGVLIHKWEEINSTDIEGLTPLLIAAHAKNLQCFSLLINKHDYCKLLDNDNCDLKLTYEGDPDGNTCWHHIANIPDAYCIIIETMSIHACSHGRKGLVQTNSGGKTAFHLAIEKGNFIVATLFSKTLKGDGLREWKSSYLVKDNDGNMPLHMVVGKSTLPYAWEFITSMEPSMELIGVQNKEGMTPIHLAVSKNDIHFLDIIFDLERYDKTFNCQILEVTDKDHNTPLHYAILQGALEFVYRFFEEGTRAENIDEILGMSNKEGNTPLHLSIKFIDLKHKSDIVDEFIKRLKEKTSIQATFEKRDNEGNTLLHLAIEKREFDLVKRLIEYALQDSCINEILNISNNNDETPASLIGSAVHLPSKFESFVWSEPRVVRAMLGVRSLSGVPTKMIKEYTNTIGVIAALLATITFTAGFTVPGGLDSSKGTPLLMQKVAFQVFMVSDIIAMCLSMMVLFFLMWIMTINNEKDQVILLDLTVLSLQGAFYATILTFMTGLYASVFPSTHWIAIFACVLCSLLILLMHKRLIILFIPNFIHIYLWYQNVKKFCGRMVCRCCYKDQNTEESSKTCGHTNERTGSQTV